MTESLADKELHEIEGRVELALQHAPEPWVGFLETREAIGGSSFVRFGTHPDRDDDFEIDLRYGADRAISPDARLDAIVELIAHAPNDLRRLIDEIRRLRNA